MVEYVQLDAVFTALADPTRRDILLRLQRGELTVSAIARPYAMSLAAISKHLKNLEKASLIIKRRSGKERYVALSTDTMRQASDYLRQYEIFWNERLDALDKIAQDNIYAEDRTTNV